MKVERIFMPNIDSNTTHSMMNLAERYPETCYPMIGLHPCSVKDDYKSELEHIETMLDTHRFYGIGETGIDLYWDKTTLDNQKKAFDYQIGLAIEHDMPVIIHSRDALDETIEMIAQRQDGKLKGIFNCFYGTIEQCRQIVDLNFMMGLGGVITYKNAGLDEMVASVPAQNLLLETDAPYLSPVPYRGKRNESSYIPIIASKVSEIRSESVSEIMQQSTTNALDLFGIER